MRQFENLDQFEVNARHKLNPQIFNYFASGAEDEYTLRENKAAFSKYYLQPRVCSGIISFDIGTEIFGVRLQRPFGFAPSAMQKLAHCEG